MKNPKLTVLVGIPGAGKSTLAEKMAAPGATTEDQTPALVVSSDKIRERINGNINDQANGDRVFKIFAQEIRDGLKAGRHVIADQTALTRRAHELLHDIARPFHIRPTAVVFTNVEEARARNLARDRVVPEHAMDQMEKNLSQILHYLDENQAKYIRIIKTN